MSSQDYHLDITKFLTKSWSMYFPPQKTIIFLNVFIWEKFETITNPIHFQSIYVFRGVANSENRTLDHSLFYEYMKRLILLAGLVWGVRFTYYDSRVFGVKPNQIPSIFEFDKRKYSYWKKNLRKKNWLMWSVHCEECFLWNINIRLMNREDDGFTCAVCDISTHVMVMSLQDGRWTCSFGPIL